MGMDERGHHAPRLSPIAGIIKQLALGGKFHLVVIVNLKTGHGLTAFFNGLHVVIPFINPLIGFLPIRSPGKIRRVNICRHPAFKPVHLIGPNEMHLSRQACAIA